MTWQSKDQKRWLDSARTRRDDLTVQGPEEMTWQSKDQKRWLDSPRTRRDASFLFGCVFLVFILFYLTRCGVCRYTQRLFHTHFKVWVMLIVEDPIKTGKLRTAIKTLFLYFNCCLSEKLNSISCSFISISFPTKKM